jgi:asparagine synthase (glutamine-hydrolysing)
LSVASKTFFFYVRRSPFAIFNYHGRMHRYVNRVVDLLDPSVNTFTNVDLTEARRRVLSGDPAAVRAIDGSFAIVAAEGITVRMARSMDRPLRYFLAKRQEGPALYVADRIDTLHQALAGDGLGAQFHPSYTRMVPAHYVVDLALVGCPDPDPVYTRFFEPARESLPNDLDEIGRRYIGALADEVAKWLTQIDQRDSNGAPIGVAFSGGVDSGSVFLVTYHTMLRLGMSPTRLKAFVLNIPAEDGATGGPDVEQARAFLSSAGLSLFLEEITARPDDLDVCETVRVLEDYKPLDVECATMGLRLCRGIRERYPEWRHLADGDGGDENLKDYPIEENHELTIHSVVDNLMLYQEGWGVGRIKHSLTYSGGLSRSYVRTYAPARRYGFAGFSPYTRPGVMEVAEGIPFAALTGYDVPTLYSLKGEIVRRGVKAITGLDMPIFPKRRFQHGAMPAAAMRARIGDSEASYRRTFNAMYA